jgi:hypothetical protein
LMTTLGSFMKSLLEQHNAQVAPEIVPDNARVLSIEPYLVGLKMELYCSSRLSYESLILHDSQSHQKNNSQMMEESLSYLSLSSVDGAGDAELIVSSDSARQGVGDHLQDQHHRKHHHHHHQQDHFQERYHDDRQAEGMGETDEFHIHVALGTFLALPSA